MLSNEKSTEIVNLIEKSKHTNAGLGGYIVYMIVLLAILVVDTIYYETHTWYNADYDIYSGLLGFVVFLYTTIYLFKGTEGYRIIYGWKRWVLGLVFAIWTLLSAYGTWIALEQTGEEIHSKTGYTQTEMLELRQIYLDEGYTEDDFQVDMMVEVQDNERYERIFALLYIASCCGLWYWTVPVKKIESCNEESDEGNTEE